MDKKTLRKKMRLKRDKMKPAAITAGSSAIAALFKSTIYPLLSGRGGIMVYLSTQSEVMTGPIINFLHSKGRRLFAPCLRGKKIFPAALGRPCTLKKGAFGIFEPAPARPPHARTGLSAVLVPGIAFDLKGNRLGFGGGYFDRFLKSLPKKTKKIALAFSGQIVQAVPKEPHDIKMDHIITEKGVFKTR